MHILLHRLVALKVINRNYYSHTFELLQMEPSIESLQKYQREADKQHTEITYTHKDKGAR